MFLLVLSGDVSQPGWGARGGGGERVGDVGGTEGGGRVVEEVRVGEVGKVGEEVSGRGTVEVVGGVWGG